MNSSQVFLYLSFLVRNPAHVDRRDRGMQMNSSDFRKGSLTLGISVAVVNVPAGVSVQCIELLHFSTGQKYISTLAGARIKFALPHGYLSKDEILTRSMNAEARSVGISSHFDIAQAGI